MRPSNEQAGGQLSGQCQNISQEQEASPSQGLRVPRPLPFTLPLGLPSPCHVARAMSAAGAACGLWPVLGLFPNCPPQRRRPH